MKLGLSEIIVVLDRSGSMDGIKDDTIGGFNTFLEKQKEVPGEAAFTLVQFDDRYEVISNAVQLSDAKPLTRETFVPRGSTALLDAIGRTINQSGKRLADLKEEDRPEKVIFVIVTDGQENASKEFSHARINEMIATQRDTYKWEFVFLGANQDAISTATAVGIKAANAMTFAAAPFSGGVGSAFCSTSANIASYRSGAAQSASYSLEDKKEQDELIKKFGH